MTSKKACQALNPTNNRIASPPKRAKAKSSLQTGANRVDLIGGAELLVLVRNEIRVGLHEDFAGRTEIELGRFVAEKFAVDAGPDEAAVGIDVDLGDTQLGGRKVFVFIHAARARVELPTGGVNALNFFHWYAGAAVHDDGQAGNFLRNGFDNVETQRLLALEFVGSVARSDRGRERITTGTLDEFPSFVGVGQASVAFVYFNVFLDAAEHAEFGFHTDALGMRAVGNAPGDGDVFVECLVAGVDHDRAVEARVDTIVAGGFITVVEMDGEDGFGKNLFGGANDCFEHPFVGVSAGAFRELDNEGRLTLDAAAEEAHRLFEVVDVVGADSEFFVGDLIELLGRNDHGG